MIIIRILQIIIGLGLLFLGRRLFWFFVAAIGFITATEIAINTMSTSPEWVIILIGLAAGLLGALLAIFFQAGAIGLAGVLGGGYLALLIMRLFEVSNQTTQIVAYIVGAVLGFLLFASFFNIAIIVISSISGSYILVNQFTLTDPLYWILLAVLAVVGIWVQYRGLRSMDKQPVTSE